MRAVFLVAFVFLFVAVPFPAFAQACSTPDLACDQGEAYSAGKAWADAEAARLSYEPGIYKGMLGSQDASNGSYFFVAGTSPTSFVNGRNFYYSKHKLCTDRKSETSSFSPKSGSLSCSSGCTQYWFRNADGTSTGQYASSTCSTSDFKDNCPSGFYWNSVLNVCEPTKEECPQGQAPNSNGKCAPEPCPDGMVQQQDGTCMAKENECPQAQVRAPDGSCIKKPDSCSTGQAMGADGTCKPDKDGDGKPDDEDSDDDGKDDKSSFSGGDSCDSPPSCSGDPVMCGQARIQWRIDCNTRRNRNIAGGACSTPPICTGDKCDAMEYASLVMQWRTACAVEKLKNGGTDGAKGDANGNGVPDVLEGTGSVADPGNGDADVAGAKRFGIGVSTDLIDKDNIFGGGSCPQPPTFKLMGQTISGADFPYFCQAAAILRALILLWGAYTALRILMGWGF